MEGHASVYQVNSVSRITGEGRAEFYIYICITFYSEYMYPCFPYYIIFKTPEDSSFQIQLTLNQMLEDNQSHEMVVKYFGLTLYSISPGRSRSPLEPPVDLTTL